MLEQRSLGQTVSQLLLTVFLGPVGRFHGFEFAVADKHLVNGYLGYLRRKRLAIANPPG